MYLYLRKMLGLFGDIHSLESHGNGARRDDDNPVAFIA